MSKTIKELADALGVSKTAVRKYMTPEFRCEHVETTGNGVLTIDSDGCKLIAMHLQRTQKLAEPTENQIPETEETTENSENLVIPRAVWDALQEQLKAKDQQIMNLTEAVKSQAQSINAEQLLHAGTMQQLLPEGENPSEAHSEVVATVQDETPAQEVQSSLMATERIEKRNQILEEYAAACREYNALPRFKKMFIDPPVAPDLQED